MTSLSVGDVAPPFGLPTDSGGAFDLYGDDVAGQFVALMFCPDGVLDAIDQVKGFADAHESLRQNGVVVAVVSHEAPSVLFRRREELQLPFELLSDNERKLIAGYDIAAGENEPHPITVLLRPNQHVLAIIRDGLHSNVVLELVSNEQNAHTKNALGFQPPILMVPDVLTREDCQRLIEVYNMPDVPMVEWSELDDIDFDSDVKTKVADYDRQDRIDHFINSEELKKYIGGRLQLRLLREIKKAFHYTVTTFEGLRIGCYEGERGGQAHGHRDNSLPDVAHRRFALSINLNAEEFEGGEIRFPEFGIEKYKPQTGAAFVFSCSLLHEALAVTHGRRFVLLAFLNGDQ